jgi:succinate-acetate transporter protein
VESSAPSGGPSTESLARVFLRPVASPLPLAFFAFGIGTLLAGMLEIGAIPVSESRDVGLILVAAVFPVQLAAALVCVPARDTPALTAVGLLAGSWLAIGLTELTGKPGSTTTTLGVFALAIGGSLLLFAVVSGLGKRFLSILMTVAAARYVLLGLHEITVDPSLETASGIVALVTAGLAAYGGLALLAEDATQRTVLPFFRAGVSRSSIEHGVQGQLDRVQREAGVRAQL